MYTDIPRSSFISQQQATIASFIRIFICSAIFFASGTQFVQAQAQSPSEQNLTAQNHLIRITSAGFIPAELTIAPGDSVTWINDQPSLIILQDQPVFHVFLPTVQKSGAAVASAVDLQPVDNSQSDSEQIGGILTLNEELRPGERYTQSFDTLGRYPFSVLNQDGLSCVIHVVILNKGTDDNVE